MTEGCYNVKCPGCGTEYTLPAAVAGHHATCEVCGKTFVLPAPEPDQIFPEENYSTTTQTVKIKPPKHEGMLPDVPDDPFKVETVEQFRSFSSDSGQDKPNS